MSMSFERHIALIPKNFVYCVASSFSAFMLLNMSYVRDFTLCYGRCECVLHKCARLYCSMCRTYISFVAVIICQVSTQQRNMSALFMVLLFTIEKWQHQKPKFIIHCTMYTYKTYIESVNIQIMHQLYKFKTKKATLSIHTMR